MLLRNLRVVKFLSDKPLTLKLVMLLALASASRASAIPLLDKVHYKRVWEVHI